MPAVKFFVCLDFERNSSSCKRLSGYCNGTAKNGTGSFTLPEVQGSHLLPSVSGGWIAIIHLGIYFHGYFTEEIRASDRYRQEWSAAASFYLFNYPCLRYFVK